MTEKIDNIVNELKTLTLLEASQLITKIEETFNVDASANFQSGVIMSNPIGSTSTDSTESIEEKTEFNVILDEVPADKKIPILKVVRTLTNLGLKEAKELVEAAPKQIQEGLAKEIAEESKKQLEAAGGKVSLT